MAKTVTIVKGRNGSRLEGIFLTFYRGSKLWAVVSFRMAGAVDWSLDSGLPNDRILRRQQWRLSDASLRELRILALRQGKTSNRKWRAIYGV